MCNILVNLIGHFRLRHGIEHIRTFGDEVKNVIPTVAIKELLACQTVTTPICIRDKMHQKNRIV